MVVDAVPGETDGVRSSGQLALHQIDDKFQFISKSSNSDDANSVWSIAAAGAEATLIGDAPDGSVASFFRGDEGVAYLHINHAGERQLWKWDTAGFEKVFAVNAEQHPTRALAWQYPANVAGQSLVFHTTDGDSDHATLWFHDYATGQTLQVGDGYRFVGQLDGNVVVHRDGVLFQWNPVTKLFSVVHADQTATGSSNPAALTATQNEIYFYSGTQLFAANRDLETSEVIPDAPASSEAKTATLGELVVVGSENGVWVHNRTTGESEWIVERTGVRPGSINFAYGSDADVLYFSLGREVWTTDGTVAGTNLLPQGLVPVEISTLEVLGDQVIVPGWTARVGDASWRASEIGPSHPKAEWAIATSKDSTYFVKESNLVFQLWKSDRTSSNTTRLVDFGATDGVHDLEIGIANGEIFVSENGIVDGTNLWKYDAQANEMVRLAQFPRGLSPNDLIEVDGKLFFSAGTQETGRELWVSDGTVDGTELAAELVAGVLGSNPSNLVASGETLYFAANDLVHGRELWVLDTNPVLDGDADNSGVVDIRDFLILAENFGNQTDDGSSVGDFNDDGIVDFLDFLELAENFGREI